MDWEFEGSYSRLSVKRYHGSCRARNQRSLWERGPAAIQHSEWISEWVSVVQSDQSLPSRLGVPAVIISLPLKKGKPHSKTRKILGWRKKISWAVAGHETKNDRIGQPSSNLLDLTRSQGWASRECEDERYVRQYPASENSRLRTKSWWI
jgi:hypothetical protein